MTAGSDAWAGSARKITERLTIMMSLSCRAESRLERRLQPGMAALQDSEGDRGGRARDVFGHGLEGIDVEWAIKGVAGNIFERVVGGDAVGAGLPCLIGREAPFGFVAVDGDFAADLAAGVEDSDHSLE